MDKYSSAMEGQKTYCVDSEDGLSPRRSDSTEAEFCSVPTPMTPFLRPADEDVYEHRPVCEEDNTVTANIVASIYGDVDEVLASQIVQALEEMAQSEGRDVSALCEARLRALEELLDPDNKNPVVTREQCFVAFQRWHRKLSCQATGDDSSQAAVRKTCPVANGIESNHKWSLSPCCQRSSNDEMEEVRHQVKVLKKTNESLQFQLSTTEKKLNRLKEEKSRLIEEARELRICVNTLQGYREEKELLEADNIRLNTNLIAITEDFNRVKKEKFALENKVLDNSETINKLVSKLEELNKSEALLNATLSRQLLQSHRLEAALGTLQKEKSDQNAEIRKLQALNQQYEERIADLTKVKANPSPLSPESDDNDSIRPVFADMEHLIAATPELTTTPTSCHQENVSLFTELMNASEEEKVQYVYSNTSTFYECVSSVNSTTQIMSSESEESFTATSYTLNSSTSDKDNLVYMSTTKPTTMSPETEDRESRTSATDVHVDKCTSIDYELFFADVATQTITSQLLGTEDLKEKWDRAVKHEADQSGTTSSNVKLEVDQGSSDTQDVSTQSLQDRTNLTLSFGIVAPLSTDAAIEDACNFSADAPKDEDCSKQGNFLASCSSNGGNHSNEESVNIKHASTMTNPGVNGSGDASFVPSSDHDVTLPAVRETCTRSMSRSISLRQTLCCSRQRPLLMRLGSNRRRRNNTRSALDREMALLESEVFEVSRGARRQYTVVSKAIEQALEAAEDYGRVVQEEKLARVVEDNTRSVRTWTSTPPLQRNASEPQLRPANIKTRCNRPSFRCNTNRPSFRCNRPSFRCYRAGVRLSRAHGLAPPLPPPPPPLPLPTITAVARSHEEATPEPINWRFAICSIFFGLAFLLVMLSMYTNQDCRYTRYRQSFYEQFIDFLQAHGIVTVAKGQRPI